MPFTRKRTKEADMRTRYRLYRTVFPALPRWVATILALA